MSAESVQPKEKTLETALRALQGQLAMVDFWSRPHSGKGMELIVINHYPVMLKIDNSDRHGRPHFHIEYKREHAASYAIDNFERLAGHMPEKYGGTLLEWAKENQALLLAKWKELHPNMPVFALELKGTNN